MPDSIVAPSDADTVSDDKNPWEAEAKKAFAKRDEIKKELGSYKETVATLESELAEFRAKAEAEAEAKKKAEGKFDELLTEKTKTFEQQIAERDQKLSELQSLIESNNRSARTNALMERIQAKLPTVNGVVLRGLLREAEAGGVDIAPESLTEDTVTDVIGRLQEMAGDFIKPTDKGVAPMSHMAPEASEKEKAVSALNRYSPKAWMKQHYGSA